MPLRIALLTVAACLLAASLLAVPARAASGDLPISVSDPAGDVTVFDGDGAKPTTGQRRSIDLTAFSVVQHGEELRFSFTLARIAEGRTFDQVVAVSFARGALQLLANPQGGHATAYVGTGTACLADVSTVRSTGTVRVDLPPAAHLRAGGCCGSRRTCRRRTAPGRG